MTQRFPGIILAGGRSQRMGEAKALLPFGAARLIDHVAARIAPQVSTLAINANDPEISVPGRETFSDSFSGFQGPLAGIHAGLRHFAGRPDRPTHMLSVPVDAPFLPQGLARRLAAALESPDDCAMAASAGRSHPVICLWPLSALPRLQAFLEQPETLRVRTFLDRLPVRTVDFALQPSRNGSYDPFFNINDRHDLEKAREILEAANSD